MATTTPKLGLQKPAVGSDDDAWGDMLNFNADTIDNLAPLASPALTGTPTAPTVSPSSDASTKLATTAFVQAVVGTVPGGATVSPTPPALNPGALWWDSTGGQLYVRYNDGNSTQWTAASSLQGQAGVATTSYVDTAVANGQRNVGRNLIHNGLFTVAQRGAGAFSADQAYTVDRWKIQVGLDTCSVSQLTIGDPGRVQIGDEEARFFLQNTFTGNAAAGSYNMICQVVEGLYRLAGKTVIISFWAKAAAGTPKLGISFDQFFGTGGSPSTGTQGTGQSVTLSSTTWTRYSLVFSIASLSGKTVGTANNDGTYVNFWCSCGASNAARAGNIGVQAAVIQLWGIQLEIAAPGQTAPSPLEKMDAQQTLAVCQRFYQAFGQIIVSGYAAAGFNVYGDFILPVTMRAVPSSVTFANTSYANGSGLATGAITASHVRLNMPVTALGAGYALSDMFISADL